jgi:hypothetical protein
MFNKHKDHQADAQPKGQGGALADAAPQAGIAPEDRVIEGAHARRVEPLGENEKPDQLADKAAAAEDRQEALLDEGVEETFPASDPVSAKHIT